MITAWIMGIVGVAVLGILVDTLMPEGNMQKYIKSIFAIIIVFVIVAPLPNILNNGIDYDISADSGGEVSLDENYLISVYKSKVKLMEKSTEYELAEAGWTNVSVTIYVDSYNENMKITGVLLNMKNLVIDKNVTHILSYEEIVSKIAAELKINKGLITRI